MHMDMKDAARAARKDTYLKPAQAAELLRQGRLLSWCGPVAHAERRDALAASFGLSAGMARALVDLVEAGATPGAVAYLGFYTAAQAAHWGLHIAPASEITFTFGKFEGVDLLEYFVASQKPDGLVTYFSRSTIDSQTIARSTCTLRTPFQIGLTSIGLAQTLAPGWGQMDKEEADPRVQRVRAQIDHMQAKGQRFGGMI